jgi:hypothetical protein
METIEKEKALDVVRQMVADGQVSQEVAEKYFPELKESEDERIRKKLVQFFKEKDEEDFEEWVPKAKVLAWLEAQGEQKSADKVKPKFKAGDWIVYKGDICQIVKREEDCNKLVTVFGIEKEPVNERNLSTARLWNIKDAKDGDVLADKFGVILFRKIGNEKYADAVDYYCAGFETGGFIIQKGVSYWGLSKEEELRPTTLEQRVRFFDTMGNAGYAWDAEKKELKKIEQKPQSTWKPSDEQMKALDFYIKTYVDTEGCYGSEVLELYEQLKKLKEG